MKEVNTMIELRKITHDNLREILALELADGQDQYVDTNIYRLASAYVKITNNEKPPILFAIYNNDEVIGFTDMGFYELAESAYLCKEFGDKATYGINHFMIDKKQQGKGLGKQAMIKIIEYLYSFPQGKADAISISYWMTNVAARGLYKSVGFIETGEKWDGNTGEKWDADREDIELAEVGTRLAF